MEILDKVFAEEGFEDGFYIKRRESMFTISADCFEPGETCFCNIFAGQGFAEAGFDINLSKIKEGFIIESGSQKGKDFLKKHSQIFGDVPNAFLSERDENRAAVKAQLEQNNASLKFDTSLKQIMENSLESDVFDKEAKNCVECQACTRICPTCHCFYLYDTQREGYFAKMKMWDSCMRLSYAVVAGGENPNKILGDRMKHRLLHKFVHFLDRYGIDMCVGCGRCVDADVGGVDIREVLKKLKSEIRG
jgi:ferredoxin